LDVPEHSKVPALGRVVVCVTGVGGPAGFNCIRSLKEPGLDARIVALDMDARAAGFYHGSDVSYVVPPATSEEFLLTLSKIIEREKVDVLIPTVDEEIAVLCREPVLERLSELTSFLLPSEAAAAKALDKRRTILEARKARLPVPKTLVVASVSELEEKSSKLNFPVVIKPSRSRGARGVSYVHRKGELGRAWRTASSLGGEVLLQEYVPGPVFTVGTVCGRHGGIAASIVLKKTKEVPPSGGVAVAGTTVAEPALQDLGERYVRCLGWCGPACPEVKLDERDGSFKLMEVNPRLFGYNYLATKAGVNLPAITARLALGEEVQPVRTYKEGLSFVRAPYDLIVEGKPGE